jgi:thiol-disulfide isomerase/thioredoxin
MIFEPADKTEGNQYDGYLRIFIVEIYSRWKMYNKQHYHNALFDFAYNDEISIRYLETYEDTINWQGDIEEDNVIVMAAVYNSDSIVNYADPPSGGPFNAHLVDAAAGAKPGTSDSNVVNDEFTHTVFCEKGTATWCPSCPSMASELNDVYESGEYPFYYVSMVVDESNDADYRMNDFSLYWLPTAFYDGGKEVVVGGGYGDEYHANLIESCGQRDVHELDLDLSVDWIAEGEMDITVSITNNEAVENNPPEKPSISGPATGNKDTDYEYTFSTSDPDGDDVYFYIDWGDNSSSEWIGPFNSGEEVKSSHTWVEDGVYIVRIKSKDMDNAESEWETLEVTMPKNRSTLNQYSNLFYNILRTFISLIS